MPFFLTIYPLLCSFLECRSGTPYFVKKHEKSVRGSVVKI
jgi:hypothetical protein